MHPPMDLRYEQRMKGILLLVGQEGASDLHLVVGRYPMLRIDGRLVPISREGVLTPDDTKGLSEVILREDNSKELLAEGRLRS